MVNLFTAIDRTQAAIEVMRETDTGSIVFIASDAAVGEIRQGPPGELLIRNPRSCASSRRTVNAEPWPVAVTRSREAMWAREASSS